MNLKPIVYTLQSLNQKELSHAVTHGMSRTQFDSIATLINNLEDSFEITTGFSFFKQLHTGSEIKKTWHEYSLHFFKDWHHYTQEDYQNTDRINAPYDRLCLTLTPEWIAQALHTRVFETEHTTDTSTYPLALQSEIAFKLLKELGSNPAMCKDTIDYYISPKEEAVDHALIMYLTELAMEKDYDQIHDTLLVFDIPDSLLAESEILQNIPEFCSLRLPFNGDMAFNQHTILEYLKNCHIEDMEDNTLYQFAYYVTKLKHEGSDAIQPHVNRLIQRLEYHHRIDIQEILEQPTNTFPNLA